ncbi:MAG: type II toxin-antitoxin system RelE/ParE family toxin [Dokdonella sp.]
MPEAERQLRKLDRSAQVSIRDAVSSKLPHFPSCSGVKALTGNEHQYRLRIGNYRVLFDYDGGVRIVSIGQVRKREPRMHKARTQRGRGRSLCNVSPTHSASRWRNWIFSTGQLSAA